MYNDILATYEVSKALKKKIKILSVCLHFDRNKTNKMAAPMEIFFFGKFFIDFINC